MNPDLRSLPLLLSAHTCRTYLSALAGGLLFVLGFSMRSAAAPGGEHVGNNTLPFQVTITITKNNALADHIQQDFVQVTVLQFDANTGFYHIPDSSIDVTFSGSTVSPVLETNSSGVATLPLSSPTAGSQTFDILIDGTYYGTTLPVIFINSPGPVDLSKSIITVVSSPAIDNGVAQDVVQAQLFDIYGNPMGNENVSFTILSGTANFVVGGVNTPSPASGITGVSTGSEPGIAQMPLNSLVVGSVVVQATYLGNILSNGSGGNSVTVQFIAGPPNPANSQLITDIASTTADGTSIDQVHAHIVDGSGFPVPGVTVTFTVTGGSSASTAVITSANPPTGQPASAGPGGTLTLYGITDANGNIILTITNTVVGDVKITAKARGVLIGPAPGTVADVSFVVGPPDPSNPASQLIVDVPSTTADGVSTDQVHVHLVDATGNVTPGAIVTFTVIGGTCGSTAIITSANPPLGQPAASGPGGSPTTVQGVTDANGNIILTLANAVTGNVILQATWNNIIIKNVNTPPGNSVSVQFVAGAPDAANSQLITDISSTTANGTSIDQVHAHIVDAKGNLVAGAIVTFTVTGGSSQGTAVITSANPPTGQPGSAGPGGSLTVQGVTDANGNIVLTITNTVVGDVQLTASVGGTVIGTPPTTADVHFVVGVPDPSNPASQFIVDVPSTTADGVSIDQVHVHLVDATGNVTPGATVTFTVTGGTCGPTAIITSANPPTGQPATAGPGNSTTVQGITDPNGNIILTLTNIKSGNVVIQAVWNNIVINNVNTPPGNSVSVQFVAGVPSATGGNTELTVITPSAPADGISTDSLNALITDAGGNIEPGVIVTFYLASGGTATGTAQFVETVYATTNSQGIATIGLTNTVAGTVYVGATILVGGVPAAITGSAQMVTFTDIPDLKNPNTELIVLIPQAIADGLGSTVVEAQVVDQNGDPLADQEVVFAIDSGNATIITPGPWITNAQGQVSISLTSKTPGYVLITATIGGKSITFGSPARVKFSPINIYVPKVFTPNGDGTNDVLKPILVGISEFHYFSVYNRWGNLIFTTQDASQGWDGRFKGTPQPIESYLWVAEGIDVEGNKVVQKGVVSLVR